MKEFPALVPQEFRMEGRGYLEAAADIKLSSAGKHLTDNQKYILMQNMTKYLKQKVEKEPQ